jgi:hypothetical protein
MVKLIEDLGETYKKIVWKFVVEINNMKVGVVYERDNNNEGFSYYKFIENKFSYDKELEDDVLSDDDKFEIEEVFFNESDYSG